MLKNPSPVPSALKRSAEQDKEPKLHKEAEVGIPPSLWLRGLWCRTLQHPPNCRALPLH